MTFGSLLTWSTLEKTCIEWCPDIAEAWKYLKLLFGSSRAYVNQTVDLNDNSFRGKNAFSQFRKANLYVAFPGDGAVPKPFAASQETASENCLPFPRKFQAYIIYN